MLYVLSCFFRDLAVGSDKSMSEALYAKMRSADRRYIVGIRDAALDLVRVTELAIGAKDEADIPVCPYGICSNRQFDEPLCEDCQKAMGA